ncbi:MAG: hypothetical protein RBQ97_12100 [Acholeplasma sp.]|nr:hypothetical protein [Acholeplasma sp.]
MFFIRCIRISNWPDPRKIKPLANISSDAITKDLKTNQNLMSWWEVDNISEQSFELIAAAIVSQYKQEDSVSLVALPKDLVCEIAQEIKHAPNNQVPIIGVGDKHYNIKILDYETLGKLADAISKVTSGNVEFVRRYKFGKLISIINTLNQENRVNKDNLEVAVKKHIT